MDLFDERWGTSGWSILNDGGVGPAMQAGPIMWAKYNGVGYPCYRWTCPKSGSYNIGGQFYAADSRGMDSFVYLVINGSITFSNRIQSYPQSASFANDNEYLNQGDTVDFTLKWGGGVSSEYSWTGVGGTITEVESGPPRLEIRVSQVELCWQTATNTMYQLQYRSTLTTNQWTPLTGTWITGDGTRYCTTDAVLAGTPQRFYRVVTPAPPLRTNMVLIPAGSFVMGNSVNTNEGNLNELPLHTVDVSAFYMDPYEVTKGLWDEVGQWATNHGYSFEYGADGKATNHPAQSMTWYDAVKWCNARSEKEGRIPAYYISAAQTTIYRAGQLDLTNGCVNWNAGYRLPTEAEWEKAARGGSSGHRFPWTDTDNISNSRANYYVSRSSGTNYWTFDTSPTAGWHPTFNDGVRPYTSPVGYFAPNSYGLCDMSGGVFEWCWDWAADYSSASQTDPRGPSSGLARIFRGGSWDTDAFACRVACRSGWAPANRDSFVGFRCVRAASP